MAKKLRIRWKKGEYTESIGHLRTQVPDLNGTGRPLENAKEISGWQICPKTGKKVKVNKNG